MSIARDHAFSDVERLAADKTAGEPAITTTTTTTTAHNGALARRVRSVLWHMWMTFAILFSFFDLTRHAVEVYRKVGSWDAATLDEKHTMTGAPFGFFAAIFLLLLQYGFVTW